PRRMIDVNARNRGDIWISDVLEAWRTLQLETPEDRAAAAEALGFDASRFRPSTETPASGAGSNMGSDDTGVGAHGKDSVSAPRAAVAASVIPSSAVQDQIAGAADEGSWATNAPALLAEQAAHTVFKPAHLPLFRPHWTRHLMSSICAVPIAEGAVDEPRLIDAVTRLRPLVRLPLRPRATLRRGVHVLVDRSESMMPFTRDVDDILRSLRATIGKDQFATAAFVDTPLAGDVLWLRTRIRAPWQAPSAGTRILLISDLGLAQHQGEIRGALPAEWLVFAARCRAAGCHTVAILPRHPDSCPPALRKVFDVVPWDARTNVATVLRSVRART
ncbi:MAG TPA: hypothetical protein VMZ33_06760, partial [Candidatus Limnocylindrales bacterium]|nr:hypothetical protein [Candidatus Limnocylindrales bacterium]